MRNLFRLCNLNRFHILSEHHPFIFIHIYCTFSIKFLPYIFAYLKMSEILVFFLSLFIFLFKFIVSVITDNFYHLLMKCHVQV